MAIEDTIRQVPYAGFHHKATDDNTGGFDKTGKVDGIPTSLQLLG